MKNLIRWSQTGDPKNPLAPSSTGTTALSPASPNYMVNFMYFSLFEMWASSILFSHGIDSCTMISFCEQFEWIRPYSCFCIKLGWLSHSGMSAETYRRHFLWFFVLTDLPCYELAPPSVVNITSLILERMFCPLAFRRIFAEIQSEFSQPG